MNFDEFNDRKNTYSTQWDFIEDRFGPNTKNLTPFSISDMDFKSPKEIINGIIFRANHGIFGYSRWNHKDYKTSIVSWYKKRFDTTINENWIAYSPNVIYSLSSLLSILVKENEKVMTHTPKYDGFSKILSSYNLIEIPLIETNIGIFKSNFDLIETEFKLGKVKVFILCNPENPTGKVWNFDELKTLIDLCIKYNVILISDDIHMDITRVKATPILKISTKNCIILNSPSKTFNTPSLGGSYTIIPSEKIRENFLFKLKNIDSLSSPTIFGVISTIIAYNNCEYWVDELNSYITKNCEYVVENLNNFMGIKAYIPQGTYLMWLDFKDTKIDMNLLKKALIEIGKVAIMSGDVYGDPFRLRLNVGCPLEKVKIGVKGIKEAVEFLKN